MAVYRCGGSCRSLDAIPDCSQCDVHVSQISRPESLPQAVHTSGLLKFRYPIRGKWQVLNSTSSRVSLLLFIVSLCIIIGATMNHEAMFRKVIECCRLQRSPHRHHHRSYIHCKLHAGSQLIYTLSGSCFRSCNFILTTDVLSEHHPTHLSNNLPKIIHFVCQFPTVPKCQEAFQASPHVIPATTLDLAKKHHRLRRRPHPTLQPRHWYPLSMDLPFQVYLHLERIRYQAYTHLLQLTA